MPASTPPETARPAPLRDALHQGRVLLLVLLDMLFSAALCRPRLHRRLPAEPDPMGGSWMILGALLLATTPLAHALAGSTLPVRETLVQQALLLAALLAFTPRRWQPLLAIYLCAASGVNLLWAAVAASGSLAGVPFALQATVALGWQGLAVFAGARERRRIGSR